MSAGTSTTPMPYIGILVKFCDQKEHADAFRNGLLYARRLKSFRGEEDLQRGDKQEGTVLMDVEQMSVRAGDEGEWLPLKVVGPLRFHYPVVDNLNIFCMTRFSAAVD